MELNNTKNANRKAVSLHCALCLFPPRSHLISQTLMNAAFLGYRFLYMQTLCSVPALTIHGNEIGSYTQDK